MNSSLHHPGNLAPEPSNTPSYEIRGPSSNGSVVDAWATDHIRFERRPPWQEQLRSELRNRVRLLQAGPDQNLHVTVFGAKYRTADVENLALYNVDDTGAAFANAARYGLCFELGASCPPSPTATRYAYAYCYELRSRSAGYRHWRERRELAAWDWVDLGTFAGPKKLEQVWLALARTRASVALLRRKPDTPFAVQVAVRVPLGVTPVLGRLVKGIFDGVVCAFQSHTDTTTTRELANRLTRNVSAPAAEIEQLLRNDDKAVVGSLPRLLHLRGDGVIWSPADDFCVAGELVVESASAAGWSIRGRITELDPRA